MAFDRNMPRQNLNLAVEMKDPLVCGSSVAVYYTTQNFIRIKLLILFAEGPAYLIPNIL